MRNLVGFILVFSVILFTNIPDVVESHQFASRQSGISSKIVPKESSLDYACQTHSCGCTRASCLISCCCADSNERSNDHDLFDGEKTVHTQSKINLMSFMICQKEKIEIAHMSSDLKMPIFLDSLLDNVMNFPETQVRTIVHILKVKFVLNYILQIDTPPPKILS